MPIVTVNRDTFFDRLGIPFESDEAFQNICFDFGIELDDVTSEKEMVRKQKGEKAAADRDDAVIYKIDVPANRYDLLCLEGLVRALRIFLGLEEVPNYRVVSPKKGKLHRMIIKPAVKQVRPFCVAAILRGIKFDTTSYNSFMDLQDKLHFNIGRRRALVSMGTHDLDTIQTPFTYDARPAEDISFVALNEDKEMTVRELFDEYKSRPVCSLKPFVPLVDESPVIPVICDRDGTVCSLPPIINSEHSKMSLNTRNVLIDVTGTDMTKVKIVLNTLCAMFSQYCSDPFTIEPVEMVYEDHTELMPNMEPTTFTADVEYINKGAGINLEPEVMAKLLYKMQLPAKYDPKTASISVEAPVSRSDILHSCDIQEDVAIAFGYNNIRKTLPRCYTIARQLPINKLSDLIRDNIAQAGFTEVLTWVLISRAENFSKLHRVDDNSAVSIGNPKTKEFEVCRTSLLPGILKTTTHNLGRVSLPLCLFEVGDVVLLDDSVEVGARNERRLSALYCGQETECFETIHGLLDRVMTLNGVKFVTQLELKDGCTESGNLYSIRESSSKTFFSGRQAEILFKSKSDAQFQVIGEFGILHPDVLSEFSDKNVKKKVDLLAAALEINLEVFLPY
eukprot:205264_1